MCANFTSIGTTALIILNRLQCELRLAELREEQKTDETDKHEDHANKKQDSEAHRNAVSERLRAFEAFERRARGEN